MQSFNENITKALELLMKAHEGQKDKAGRDYRLHPITVAFIAALDGGDENCIITALLHDIVEDTQYTLDDIKKLGFNDTIISALSKLTHDKSVPYMDYIKNIKTNNTAAAVKRADLKHNMDLTRLDKVTDEDLKRVEKYKKSLNLLKI